MQDKTTLKQIPNLKNIECFDRKSVYYFVKY